VSKARIPHSLRSGFGRSSLDKRDVAGGVTTAALIAIGSIGSAEAQVAPGASLPPVSVDPPMERARPQVRPTQQQIAARGAMRRRARQSAQSRAPAAPAAAPAASPTTPIIAQLPDGNPYANPAAPYKADRLQSNKFTEPLLNTPKTVTVLTKEVLEDRKLTTLADVARTTPGITIGTGEGGNAFGDRFFIRGFDARSDIFVDGIRDTSVNVRENFFTEQIEILRGPGSTFAGRGVAGGAINIVTKQAGDKDFYKGDLTGGLTSDQTKRITLDINQTITPDFSVRMNGMYQDAGIAGRNQVFDNRWGGAIATKWTPTDWLKITTSYAHTEFDMRPDFGVPIYRQTSAGRTIGNFQPVPESLGVSRDTWYGQRFRDYYQAKSDIATIRADAILGDGLTLSNATRYGLTGIDYIGSIPQSINVSNPNPTLWTVNTGAQSRNQENQNITNQTDLTYRFDTGPVKHTTIVGMEFANERIWRTNYSGLTSELAGSPVLGSPSIQNLYTPYNYRTFQDPFLNRNGRTLLMADTKSAYLIETANYNDFLILTGGVRYDGYKVNVRSGTNSNTISSDNVNYNLGLTIKPTKEFALYAAMATSSNPLGAEFDAGDPAYGGLSATPNAVTNALPPEQNTAYEVGAKYEMFDGKLLATAAYFETYKDKAREQGAGNVWLATGRYKVNGFDFGLTGKITDKWSIFAGATFFESEVLKSITQNNVGRRLANLADNSFSVMSKYKVFDWLELGGAANYRSEIWGGTFAATTYNKLPGYWRFDAFAEAKVTQNLKLTLNVLNVFDKVYYDAFYRSNTPFAYIAPGRTVLLTASAKF
jgi:catecholate siderophore receptor